MEYFPAKFRWIFRPDSKRNYLIFFWTDIENSPGTLTSFQTGTWISFQTVEIKKDYGYYFRNQIDYDFDNYLVLLLFSNLGPIRWEIKEIFSE
jgi:hypothetical protein